MVTIETYLFEVFWGGMGGACEDVVGCMGEALPVVCDCPWTVLSSCAMVVCMLSLLGQWVADCFARERELLY